MAKQYVIMQDNPWAAGFMKGDIVEFRPEGNRQLKWVCTEGSCVGDRWSMPDPDGTGVWYYEGDLAYTIRPEKPEVVLDPERIAAEIVALQAAGIMTRAKEAEGDRERAKAWRGYESDAYENLIRLGIPVRNPHK